MKNLSDDLRTKPTCSGRAPSSHTSNDLCDITLVFIGIVGGNVHYQLAVAVTDWTNQQINGIPHRFDNSSCILGDQIP